MQNNDFRGSQKPQGQNVPIKKNSVRSGSELKSNQALNAGIRGNPVFDAPTELDPCVLTETIEDTAQSSRVKNLPRVRSKSWNELSKANVEIIDAPQKQDPRIDKLTRIVYALAGVSMVSFAISIVSIFLFVRSDGQTTVVSDKLGKLSSSDIEDMYAVSQSVKKLLAQQQSRNGAVSSLSPKSVTVDKLNISTSQLPGTWIVQDTLPYDRIMKSTIPPASQVKISVENLEAGSITAKYLAPNSVTDDNIINLSATKLIDTISMSLIKNGDISDSKISQLSATKLIGFLNPEVIPDNSISNDMIQRGISGTKITDSTITFSKLSGFIPSSFIADNSIENIKLQSGINGAKISSGTIGFQQIANNAISTDKIQAAAINSVKIQDGQVLDSHLANGISGAKISTGTITQKQLNFNMAHCVVKADGATIPANCANVGVSSRIALVGSYTVSFAAGTFLSPPVVIVTPEGTDGAYCTVTHTKDSANVYCFRQGVSGPLFYDTRFFIFAIGS